MHPFLIVFITITSALVLFTIIFLIKRKRARRNAGVQGDVHATTVVTTQYQQPTVYQPNQQQYQTPIPSTGYYQPAYNPQQPHGYYNQQQPNVYYGQPQPYYNPGAMQGVVISSNPAVQAPSAPPPKY